MNFDLNIDVKTKYLLSIAMCCNNYSSYLNVPDEDFANILGIVYRMYQDKIKGVSNQGIALLIAFLTKVKEDEYGKYIDILKDKLDNIIDEKSTIKEQIEEINKYR